MKSHPVRIAIFASGAGTNAREIFKYFQKSDEIHVVAVFSNKAGAGVLNVADEYNAAKVIFGKNDLLSPQGILDQLKAHQVEWIILAGFLWKVPDELIRAYPNRIINIHPALLPKFGGKGMYGMHVHQAVKEAGEDKSGITIHYVNEHYDEGGIIAQKETALTPDDSPESIAQKVQELEHFWFPRIIEQVVLPA